MKKKIMSCRIFLGIGILAVLLTIIVPGVKVSIGHMITQSYDGLFSVIVLCISLGIFFTISKGIEDVFTNRMKVILSGAFLLSLFSNLIFS